MLHKHLNVKLIALIVAFIIAIKPMQVAAAAHPIRFGISAMIMAVIVIASIKD